MNIQSPHKNDRRGVAAVEAAICVPLVAMLVFGSIESSNAIFLKQTLTVAAYESAQVATSNGGTEAGARQRANEILSAYNIQGSTVTISPAITATTARGTKVTVTVTLPMDQNRVGPAWFFGGTTLTRQFSMNRL